MIPINNQSSRRLLTHLNKFLYSLQGPKTSTKLLSKDASTKSLTPITHGSLTMRPSYNFSNNQPKNPNIAQQALTQFLNHPYSRLCRWDKPIGALLLFWPCLWGI